MAAPRDTRREATTSKPARCIFSCNSRGCNAASALIPDPVRRKFFAGGATMTQCPSGVSTLAPQRLFIVLDAPSSTFMHRTVSSRSCCNKSKLARLGQIGLHDADVLSPFQAAAQVFHVERLAVEQDQPFAAEEHGD